MSLRILFADDSMTAQNMGKKILSDAGYDVVAVSNGAAAVKKIAEQKPDIIILDVYMPGYTGLEVCEKVRGSLDTLKTPVLLTVGKMEPYKPEDANRVKADGVIIKPFEASDLLAIVKKFEERIGNAPPPMAAQAPLLDRQEEEAAPPEMHVEPAPTGRTLQPMVEVPDHMASSAAFGDLLGGEPASTMNHYAVNTPAATFETSVIVPAPPVPAAEHEASEPIVAAPVQTLPEPEEVSVPAEVASEIVATPVEAVPESAPASAESAPEAAAIAESSEARHAQFIPVFKEPEHAPEPEYTFMPTSAPPLDELEIPREPALQESAEVTTRNTIVDQVEPGLMSTTGQQVESVSSRPAPEPELAPPAMAANAASGPVTDGGLPLPLPVTGSRAEVNDADFEARVAAAMAAYNHASEPATAMTTASPAEALPAEPSPGASASDVGTEVSRTEQAYAAAVPLPSFEYQPPVRSAEPPPVGSAPTSAGYVSEDVAEAPAPPMTHPGSVDPAAVAASVEAALPATAASVATEAGADHSTIAQAVHRVMERLKPELVEEIMKELKSKK